MRNIPISEELESICKEIHLKGFSEKQWSEIESDDMFQSKSLVGGYDADENEFCFSYTQSQNEEYWFQFSLALAIEISNGGKPKILGRMAE